MAHRVNTLDFQSSYIDDRGSSINPLGTLYAMVAYHVDYLKYFGLTPG